jgi:hypothetical protein
MYQENYTSNVMVFVEAENEAGEIKREYEAYRALFASQPADVQQFLMGQARMMANMLLERRVPVHFKLSKEVILRPGQSAVTAVPEKLRDQLIGGMMDRIGRFDIQTALQQRISELEQSSNQAIAVSAMLIRHATVIYMVYQMLPSGHLVRYFSDEGDEIPSLPEENSEEAAKDKLAGIHESSEILTPFVPDARRFYLPQWVAFGGQDELLVNSFAEAEANLASMQRFMAVLQAAAVLAPYMVVDDVYQQKRYGMLGQFVNQGRALGRYKTSEIIKTIYRKAKAGELNRGLSLNLPYFDDQELAVKTYSFVVIPAGFILFIPAFVVRAVLEERVKIVQDTHLNPSTRKHLLRELRALGYAFEVSRIPD